MRNSLSLALSVAAVTALSTHAFAEVQPDAAVQPLYKVVKVSAHDVLNVRKGPSTAFPIVTQLPANSEGVKLGACKGQWCQVSHQVGEGWAFRGYLAPQAATQTASVQPQVPAAMPADKPPLAKPAETKPADAGQVAAAAPKPQPEKPLSPPERAFRYFVEQGWGEHHAAGIVGNLQAECGQMLNCSIGSGGIAQWRAERVTRFHKVFGYPFARAKFTDQLAYIQWELTHPASPWKDSGRVLKRANDAATAAALFDAHYERSAGTTRGARMANARAILKRYGTRTASAG
jgi:uncharacterized protein YraI